MQLCFSCRHMSWEAKKIDHQRQGLLLQRLRVLLIKDNSLLDFFFSFSTHFCFAVGFLNWFGFLIRHLIMSRIELSIIVPGLNYQSYMYIYFALGLSVCLLSTLAFAITLEQWQIDTAYSTNETDSNDIKVNSLWPWMWHLCYKYVFFYFVAVRNVVIHKTSFISLHGI